MRRGIGLPQPLDQKPTAEIRSRAQARLAGPGASATEGEGALTERAQRQRTWALTGGPGRQGTRARSGTRSPGRAIRIGRRGSEADQGRRARVREAVPAVRAVRSGSDGGDQTGEG
jgi:hypothetical protein